MEIIFIIGVAPQHLPGLGIQASEHLLSVIGCCGLEGDEDLVFRRIKDPRREVISSRSQIFIPLQTRTLLTGGADQKVLTIPAPPLEPWVFARIAVLLESTIAYELELLIGIV